jgi:hypothetical protein
VQFLIHATGLQSFINLLTFDAILGMVIDSFINMIKALLWFNYWPDVFEMENIAIWFITIYIGYRVGAHLAQRYVLHLEKSSK